MGLVLSLSVAAASHRVLRYPQKRMLEQASLNIEGIFQRRTATVNRYTLPRLMGSVPAT